MRSFVVDVVDVVVVVFWAVALAECFLQNVLQVRWVRTPRARRPSQVSQPPTPGPLAQTRSCAVPISPW